jgi:hypothetical protein
MNATVAATRPVERRVWPNHYNAALATLFSSLRQAVASLSNIRAGATSLGLPEWAMTHSQVSPTGVLAGCAP